MTTTATENETAAEPRPGDLRIYYIPQVPMKAYEADIPRGAGESDSAYLERAAFVLRTVVEFSIFEFENNVKPDYSDVAAIVRWEPEPDGGDGFDWFDVDESEYEEWF